MLCPAKQNLSWKVLLGAHTGLKLVAFFLLQAQKTEITGMRHCLQASLGSCLVTVYFLYYLVSPYFLQFILSDLLSIFPTCSHKYISCEIVYPVVGLSRQRELRAASMSYLQSGNREDECILYYSMVLRRWEQGMKSYGSKVMCVSQRRAQRGKASVTQAWNLSLVPRRHKEMAGENQKAVLWPPHVTPTIN